ncbi:MAG: trypsin-like serine protease [Polyangiaceae bacterium]|nr:trypsin-like serine protease [Polyangiaceae bacterium]
MLTRPISFASVALLALLTACAGGDASPEGGEEADLSNGAVAGDDAFPSTLLFNGACTGAHVGEKLILTAAHCVRDARGAVQPGLMPGNKLSVAVRGKRPSVRQLEIAKTTIHPRTVALCAAQGCGTLASSERRDAPDVAVIEVTGGLGDIAVAEVDVAPLKVGDAVTILGYGCTDRVNVANADGKLRFRNTRAVDVTATVHAGGLAATETTALETVRSSYAITPGPRQATSEPVPNAGLCPGDSGGPLFRAGTNRVVGVNASYTFLPSERLPVTNWHARVDGDARWGVAAWLKALGANMRGTCTASTCRAPRGS